MKEIDLQRKDLESLRGCISQEESYLQEDTPEQDVPEGDDPGGVLPSGGHT